MSTAVAFDTFYSEGGRVVSADGDRLEIETSAGTLLARRAASCLLEPRIGDEVLVAVGARGESYVTAVLTRSEASPATLSAPGEGLEVIAPRGRLTFVAPEGVELVGGKALRLSAEEVAVHAREGTIAIGRMLVQGKEALVHVPALKGVFDKVETTANRVMQRAKRSFRVIEETDTTRAGDIDTRAENGFVLRAKDALMNARRLVKMDAEQIHIG
ncbi:MAG: DUF3540 domain-containing protein [Sandaracinaceae bacterium]